MAREFGVVKTFDLFKGYGFIRRSKGKDVFVYFEQVEGDDQILDEGTKVSFEVVREPKGDQAYKVRIEGE
ncbi:cold shock domain-containing protein [Idiomarina loihiensis]|uniref:cold shock domain-containing protein n=1 Tax=Idiomarina loihiensis TaxID=135577 RepID=UPI00384DA21A